MHKNKYWKYTQIFAVTKSSKSIKYWRLMKILADIQNICVSWNYWRIPKILADVQNIGGCPKYWRVSKILADVPNIGGCPKYWRMSKILAGAQNIGGCPKYWRVSKIWRPYCLGSAESPAADFLLVWLKSSRSDPRRCDVLLMPSPSERWTACMLLLFAHSLPYCTGWLYRPDKPKFAWQSKIYPDIKILGGRVYFENFRQSLGANSSAPRPSIKKP